MEKSYQEKSDHIPVGLESAAVSVYAVLSKTHTEGCQSLSPFIYLFIYLLSFI